MNAIRPNHELMWICPTAGHLIGEMDQELFLTNRKTGHSVPLKIPSSYIRASGRLRGRYGKPISFQDDCAFLLIEHDNLHQFQKFIPNINPFQLIDDLDDTIIDITDLLCYSRYRSISNTIRINGMIVYKVGSSSEITAGYLIEQTKISPRAWFVNESFSVDELDQDEWLGIVRWFQDDPFSAPGDSRSLVFTRKDGIVIPLGIHIGAPDSMPGHSVFISLETFCFEAESEGWEVRLATGSSIE